MEVCIHAFLSRALDWGEWLASQQDLIAPWDIAPLNHSIEGCVNPITCQDLLEKMDILMKYGMFYWARWI